MDLATLGGLILGALIVLVSLAMTGTPVATWINPEALLIVLGGTITASMVHYRLGDLWATLGALKSGLTNERQYAREVADIVVDAATFIRAQGLLAAQPLLADLHLPLLQKGLQMIIDQQSIGEMEQKIMVDMEGLYLKQCRYAQILEFAGGVAPTMGILGAIVGLIQVSGLMSNPELIGQGIARAFTATMYGVGFSNLMVLPLAGKLRQHAQDIWRTHCMLLEGMVSIALDENPMVTREKVEAYLAHAYDTPVHTYRSGYGRGGADPLNYNPGWSPDDMSFHRPLDGVTDPMPL